MSPPLQGWKPVARVVRQGAKTAKLARVRLLQTSTVCPVALSVEISVSNLQTMTLLGRFMVILDRGPSRTLWQS
jgi:hypothetical protein